MFSLLQFSFRLNKHRSVQSENDFTSGEMRIEAVTNPSGLSKGQLNWANLEQGGQKKSHM